MNLKKWNCHLNIAFTFLWFFLWRIKYKGVTKPVENLSWFELYMFCPTEEMFCHLIWQVMEPKQRISQEHSWLSPHGDNHMEITTWRLSSRWNSDFPCCMTQTDHSLGNSHLDKWAGCCLLQGLLWLIRCFLAKILHYLSKIVYAMLLQVNTVEMPSRVWWCLISARGHNLYLKINELPFVQISEDLSSKIWLTTLCEWDGWDRTGQGWGLHYGQESLINLALIYEKVVKIIILGMNEFF